jgi:integrase
MLLFFQGLRVGEMASLPADFIHSEIDERTGKKRWYMSVKTAESEDDPRYSKPSIKTVDSIRTIPMTGLTASIVQTYMDNYRGKPNCIQFLVSMHKKPMSMEGVRHAFRRLTGALTPGAREQLFNQTGAARLHPHALRHTCAVVRMRQWTAAGQSPEQAMQHMRSFFGWSKESLMPMLYAKAALDERRNETWNEQMDDRVSMLRDLPE